jgi:LDH2 family malate/lactate/ureidoglycolate dehydrogenase
MAEEGPIRVREATARAWTTAVFGRVGMSPADAEVVSDNLVTADLRGVYSHGIMRVPTYVQRIQAGVVNPQAVPRVVREQGAVALWDGDNGMGQVVGLQAMDAAIARAGTDGTGLVLVRGSNHFGAAAHFALRAVPARCIGVAFTIGGTNIMAPWGAAEPLLGNNPFAMAVPAGRHDPLVLDMALSVVARGKIVWAMKTGQAIPEGWALDADGQPTTDPQAAYEGLVRPVGDYKGAGLAFMLGLITAALSGAAFGRDVTDFYREFTRPQNVGHAFAAVAIEAVTSFEAFCATVDAAIDLVHAARRSPGVDRVWVPGEPEAERARAQRERGIAYPAPVVAELNALGTTLGIGPLALVD